VYWLELAGEEDAFAAREARRRGDRRGAARAGSRERRQRRSRSRRSSRGRRHRDPPARLHPRRPRGDRPTEADLAAAAAALDAAPLDRSGTVAVRARNVRNTTDISTSAAERELGGVLVDRGFDVDLDDPDHVLRALFAAGERDDHEGGPGR